MTLAGSGGDFIVDTVRIGLLGYGTIGSNVGMIQKKNAEEIMLATGNGSR